MLRNYPGFYTYSVLERLDGWPEVEIGQIRIVYKLQQDKYFTTYKSNYATRSFCSSGFSIIIIIIFMNVKICLQLFCLTILSGLSSWQYQTIGIG